MYVTGMWSVALRGRDPVRYACVGHNASFSSCKNVVNSFVSTEFRSLEVLNIFKAFPVNLSPGYKYVKV